MFKIFKNFITYFLILRICRCKPLPSNNGGKSEHITTIDYEQEVNLEIAPFEDLIREFNTGTSLTEYQILVKGEILGRLKQMIKNAIKVDNLNQKLLREQGTINLHKDRGDLYRVLLGIGHRVDQLEEILSAGSEIVLGGDRDKRWTKILQLETPIVKEFRERIIEAGLDVNLFARNVQLICQERNERAGHGDVSLPEVLHENSYNELFRLMKIPRDQNSVITLKLLMSPLTLPSTTTPKSK